MSCPGALDGTFGGRGTEGQEGRRVTSRTATPPQRKGLRQCSDVTPLSVPLPVSRRAECRVRSARHSTQPRDASCCRPASTRRASAHSSATATADAQPRPPTSRGHRPSPEASIDRSAQRPAGPVAGSLIDGGKSAGLGPPTQKSRKGTWQKPAKTSAGVHSPMAHELCAGATRCRAVTAPESRCYRSPREPDVARRAGTGDRSAAL